MEFAQKKGFKTFMARLYGWGASLVIVGALFKIQHWTGAGIMLTIGLSTEAIIFFFSAFEKPHAEPDWSLVYPELAGMHDEEPKKIEKDSSSATQKIDKMLSEAKIGPELIESLGVGLKNLSDSTSKMADLSNTVAANNEFTSNLKNASQSVSQLNSSYQQTQAILSKDINVVEEFASSIKGASASANNLSGAYQQVSEVMKNDINAASEYVSSVKDATNSVNQLKSKYIQSAEYLAKTAESIDFSNIDTKSYEQQVTKITKNLEALNSVYELQLQSVGGQLNTSKTVSEGMNKFLQNIEKSVESSNHYQELVNNLNNNMAILNKVYGNMLAAMNVNMNK
ncbi:MAG: gliding motility protein GldL [Bacteroidales bacterium]|nr:gliding motility protein GldL [Bacteroidales bacterium]